MQRRILWSVGFALSFLAPFVAPATAQAQGSISLALSPRAVTYGQHQEGSGAVQDGATCSDGRAVDLQQQAPGTSAWTVLASATSSSDGSFSFAFVPSTNATYRAVAEPGALGAVACSELDSPPQPGRVFAAVTLRLGRATIRAGDCEQATAVVKPTKAGQHVLVQRDGGTGWTDVSSLTLDSSSQAPTTICARWPDIGTARLRATWPQQDPSNAPGASSPERLQVMEAVWMQHIDRVTRGHAVGISVHSSGRVLYQRQQDVAFAPASNQKLLLSMALLDRLGPSTRIETDVAAVSVRNGVVHGNLWILGHGDPSTGKAELARLARAVERAGVRRVTGSVMGSTGYFAHDWFAPGWKANFRSQEVGLPSALSFRENSVGGVNVSDPERVAAQALTRWLKRIGVRVGGRPGWGTPGAGVRLQVIGAVQSPPLAGLIAHMDHLSDNFYAEVLGKRLGVAAFGVPGTIARGASAISSWTSAHGVVVHSYDSSGLSYDDRVSPEGIATLLTKADALPWGPTLRAELPGPGDGTIQETHSLHGVNVRAKTGSLDGISALSGWVWLSTTGRWAEFSILDRGMASWFAKPIEDEIVRTIARFAH